MSRSTGRPRLVLPLLALALLGILTACTLQTQAELTTYPGVNAIRRQAGLPPLTPDVQLVQLARIRSQDMATNNYFSHYPPNGCNYACLMDEYGVVDAYAGENIAWITYPWSHTGAEAIQMWQNSPPHLANILNCHYTRFGTGVAQAVDGKIYFTMLFEGNAGC